MHQVETLVLGQTPNGKPITAVVKGDRYASHRIVVVAGQHGDEPLPVEAARELTIGLSQSAPCRLSLGDPTNDLAIAILANANPDGSNQRSRHTSEQVDLNRDHLLQTAPETKAIHKLLTLVRPTLVIDLHQFKARRKWMRELGFCHAADICLDWTTSPVANHQVRSASKRLVRQSVAELDRQRWRVSRYLVRSGTGCSRPSTPQLLSLINHASVRHNAASVLIEVREPENWEASPIALQRATNALRAAIESCCRFHINDLPVVRRCERQLIAINARPTTTAGRPKLWTRNRRSRQVQLAEIPGKFRNGWMASGFCQAPLAYGLPADWTDTIDWLDGHGCRPIEAEVRQGVIRRAIVEKVVDSRNRTGQPRRIEASWHDASLPNSRFTWIQTTPETARFLVAVLEPKSKYGAVRNGLLPWRPTTGDVYPVARLELHKEHQR